jgi:DNA-binding winged helix-turn-helix (wHTH) protein
MTADFSSAIDLAEVEHFRLGSAEIHPALSEVIWEGGRVALQPRVMQVLVVLGAHLDKVISRDVLIETCWGGRAVGDDAINRCISQLRKLAQQTGAF